MEAGFGEGGGFAGGAAGQRLSPGSARRAELALMAILALTCDGRNPAQTQHQPIPGSGIPTHASSADQAAADQDAAIDDVDKLTTARHLRAYYLLQQQAMVRDTDRLLALATQLNAEVSSEHSGTLTREERRQAGEIEKLARSVREKMSEPVPGGMMNEKPGTVFTF
jgi:hypothetical protein